jgi:selenocysteine lyase/cysteine desulfurase
MNNFITGQEVEALAAAGGKRLVLGKNDSLTGIARENCEKLGIAVVPFESEASRALSSSPTAPSGLPGRNTGSGRAPGTFIPEFFQAPSSYSAPSVHARPSTPPRTIPQARSSGAFQPEDYDIDAWRAQFPILKESIHLANCSQSPQCTRTRKAAEDYLDNWDHMGMDWDRWVQEVNLAKAEFAKLINADPGEIAIGTSVSEITSTIASALDFGGKRKKVVVTDAEFPTVGLVWLANEKYGARVKFIPAKNGEIDINDYHAAVDQETLITSFCDVYYYNGFKQDIGTITEMVHAKGSLAYLDAYQGIGSHPIDVKALDIDILSSGNLKYLLGIPGIAFVYVKKELIPYMQPAFTGWFGQENPFAFDIHHLDYAKDARRFDNGTPPVLTSYIARAGMQVINEIGPASIQRWTDRLSEHCLEGARRRGLEIASPQDVRKKAPTTAIRVGSDSHGVEVALKERKIVASARGDVVRFAHHFFTKPEDLDYALDSLVDILKR